MPLDFLYDDVLLEFGGTWSSLGVDQTSDISVSLFDCLVNYQLHVLMLLPGLSSVPIVAHRVRGRQFLRHQFVTYLECATRADDDLSPRLYGLS